MRSWVYSVLWWMERNAESCLLLLPSHHFVLYGVKNIIATPTTDVLTRPKIDMEDNEELPADTVWACCEVVSSSSLGVEGAVVVGVGGPRVGANVGDWWTGQELASESKQTGVASVVSSRAVKTAKNSHVKSMGVRT